MAQVGCDICGKMLGYIQKDGPAIAAHQHPRLRRIWYRLKKAFWELIE